VATQLAAYRITQEALSNAVRHAPGAPITVDVAAEGGDVRIAVRNASDAVQETGAGHGLRGMAERAALVGGTLVAGRGGEGSWVVEARLPRHPALPNAKEDA